MVNRVNTMSMHSCNAVNCRTVISKSTWLQSCPEWLRYRVVDTITVVRDTWSVTEVSLSVEQSYGTWRRNKSPCPWRTDSSCLPVSIDFDNLTNNLGECSLADVSSICCHSHCHDSVQVHTYLPSDHVKKFSNNSSSTDALDVAPDCTNRKNHDSEKKKK